MASSLLDSLVSYWKFDESSGNAFDSKGTNTLTNVGVVPYVSGKINNAASLVSASSNYFSITNSLQSGLNLTSQFSISFWFKSSAFASKSYFLVKYGSVGNRGISFFYDNVSQLFHLEVSEDGTTPALSRNFSFSLSTNIWYNVTITVDGIGEITLLYINAQLVGVYDNNHFDTIFPSTATFYIGNSSSYDLPATYSTFLIDLYGIWSRPLTSDEVSLLYLGGSGSSYPFYNDNLAPLLGTNRDIAEVDSQLATTLVDSDVFSVKTESNTFSVEVESKPESVEIDI